MLNVTNLHKGYKKQCNSSSLLEDRREEWRLGGQILSHSLYQKKILSPVGVVFGDLRNEETLQKKKQKNSCVSYA